MNRGTVPDVIVMNDNDDQNGWSDLIKWDRETSVMMMIIKLEKCQFISSIEGQTGIVGRSHLLQGTRLRRMQGIEFW